MSGPDDEQPPEDRPAPEDQRAPETPPEGQDLVVPAAAAGPIVDAGPSGPSGPPTRAERTRVRSTRVRRRRRIVFGIGGGLLVLVLAFTLWYQLESHALGAPGRQVVIKVHEDESSDAVTTSLSNAHVIGSSLAFRIANVFHGAPNPVPGSYALHENQTFGEVRAILAAGPNIYPINVVPGYALAEVATQVDSLPGHSEGQFSKLANSGAVRSTFSPADSNNLEGMLGTGEYLVLPGESDLTLLRQMVTRFDNDAEKAGLSTASAADLGLTPYEVIIAASIVQKEGYYPINMPKTARVIYNRLANDMPLQMDSTVLYALGQDGGPVTSHDLQIQSPYNTYLNVGLTPTPICMPSQDALEAAVDPPAGAWLYFVLVEKNGVMAFSDTYTEQLANEALAKSRGLP